MDEILQFLEVSIRDGQEVHYGHHLLLQGQRVVLAQPELGLGTSGSCEPPGVV